MGNYSLLISFKVIQGSYVVIYLWRSSIKVFVLMVTGRSNIFLSVVGLSFFRTLLPLCLAKELLPVFCQRAKT